MATFPAHPSRPESGYSFHIILLDLPRAEYTGRNTNILPAKIIQKSPVCLPKACKRGAELPPAWEPKCHQSLLSSSWHWHHIMPLARTTVFHYKSKDGAMCSEVDGGSPLGADSSHVQSSWGSYRHFGSPCSFPLSGQQRDEWGGPQSPR